MPAMVSTVMSIRAVPKGVAESVPKRVVPVAVSGIVPGVRMVSVSVSKIRGVIDARIGGVSVVR